MCGNQRQKRCVHQRQNVVPFCSLKITSQIKEMLQLWVSTSRDRRSGERGLCGVSKTVSISNTLMCSVWSWLSGRPRWLACWDAEGWIKGRADVFYGPPSLLWKSLCVYMWAQHDSSLPIPPYPPGLSEWAVEWHPQPPMLCPTQVHHMLTLSLFCQ